MHYAAYHAVHYAALQDFYSLSPCAAVPISVSAQDGIVALGKVHMLSAPSLSCLPKVALEAVSIFAWLNTDRSRTWRLECQPLPFSTPLSFSNQRCDSLACPRVRHLSQASNRVHGLFISPQQNAGWLFTHEVNSLSYIP